ncbi:hypothetical protein Scep_012560 [Stephania cephalantha]|uniref:GAG-pre-integrase domain-containing protein n=1 Tax=Stephania cephalantha TaxID=152367 RepID=A0AAP0JFS1_9MAGN
MRVQQFNNNGNVSNQKGQFPRESQQANFVGNQTQFGSSSHHATFPSTKSITDSSWYADSGATAHVTPDPNQLTGCAPYQCNDTLVVGNVSALPIAYVGSAHILSANIRLRFPNTLCVPHIKKNLLSISQLTRDNNVVIEFTDKLCLVNDSSTKELLLEGTLQDGLYQFSTSSLLLPTIKSSRHSAHTTWSAEKNSTKLWHLRLGHPAKQTLHQILRNSLHVSCSDDEFCSVCPLGKHHSLPFSTSNSCCKHLLDKIHTDVWGPSPVTSSDGSNYYISFVNDCTRFTWIFPLKKNSDVFNVFKQF